MTAVLYWLDSSTLSSHWCPLLSGFFQFFCPKNCKQHTISIAATDLPWMSLFAISFVKFTNNRFAFWTCTFFHLRLPFFVCDQFWFVIIVGSRCVLAHFVCICRLNQLLSNFQNSLVQILVFNWNSAIFWVIFEKKCSMVL